MDLLLIYIDYFLFFISMLFIITFVESFPGFSLIVWLFVMTYTITGILVKSRGYNK